MNKQELSIRSNDHNKNSRNDLRFALSWTIQSNFRTFLVVVIFLLAGVASIFGFLRLQILLLKISFSVICLAVIIIILIAKFKRNYDHK